MDRLINGNQRESAVNLTNSERQYLEAVQPIIVCPDPDWPPFEYWDQDGQFCGIAADLVALVFDRLSTPYQCTWAKDWNETLSLSKARKIDIIPFLNESPEREQWLAFTEPIFVDPNVFVTRMEHPFLSSTAPLENELIAFPEGTAVEKRVKERRPNLNVVHTKSELETFQFVADGTAGLTLRSLMVAAYTLGVARLDGLKIAGQMPEVTNYLRMGVLREKTPLRDILNKAIATITPEEQVDIVDRHVNSKLAAVKQSSNAQMMLAVAFLTSSNWYWNYQLQRHNERYGILLDYMQDQVWYLQNSSTYGAVNRAHADFLGIDRHDLQHKSLWEVLPPTVAEVEVRHNQRVFSEQRMLQSEEWFVDGHGRDRLLRVSRVPKVGVHGAVDYVVCSAVDMTERHIIEQQLFIEKEQFRTTLLSVSDGVISADTTGRLVVINEAACRFTGWTEAQAIGRRLDEVFSVVHEDTLQPYDLGMEYVVHGGTREIRDPISLVARDGTTLSIEASVASIRENPGQHSGVVVVFRDVTQQRERHRQAEYFSLRDPLTGLYNRRFFDEELERLNVPRNLPLSLLLADANALKLTNDAFGHQAGDQLLQSLGQALHQACRADDIVARIGGDEFVLLLPNTSHEDAMRIQQRVNDLLVGQHVEAIPLSLSCGISTKVDASQSIKDVFKAAERRMYRAKVAGRKTQRAHALDSIKKRLFGTMPDLKLHARSVRDLCRALAEELELEEPKVEDAAAVGELHDVGKVALHADILMNRSRLTLSDRNEFRRHPDVGFNILIGIEEYAPLAYSVLAHHEHWDGSGYPKGLSGLAIPLYGRITAVADAYDIMTRSWPDRTGIHAAEALSKIIEGSGSQYDPEIVEALLRLYGDKYESS